MIESEDNLLAQYQTNPVINTLIQLLSIKFPIIGAGNAFISTVFTTIEKKRCRIFFDELSSGEIELTDEIIKSEEFLHCYQITVSAFLRTYREEKIRLFARLLNGYYTKYDFKSIDEYEEMISILDELSYREIMILCTLKNELDNIEYNETESTVDDVNAAKVINNWDSIKISLCSSFDLEQEELISILNRLYRSGCYVPCTGRWGFSSGMGTISSLFERVIRLT